MNHLRRMLSVASLFLLSLCVLVFLAPASTAAVRPVSPTVSPTTTRGPMALASTGFDITVPVIIGLTTLVLGIGLLAWAFLRTGSTNHHH